MDSGLSGSEHEQPDNQVRLSQNSSEGQLALPSDETSMQGSTKSMLTESAGPFYELPSVKQLADLYPSSVQHSWRRLERLGKKFRDTFATGVSHLIRVPAQLKIPNDNSELRLHDYGLINLESDIVVAIGYKENARCGSKFENLTYDDKNHYRNLLVCAIKICLSLGVEVMFNGTCVLFDSTIPTGQKLGLILAFMVSPKKLQEDGRARLPVFPDRLIERILFKFEKIRDDSNFHREDVEFGLSAYFYGKNGTIAFRAKNIPETAVVEDTLNHSEDTSQHSKSTLVTKGFLDEPSIIYMESVAGSSKSKENIQRVKMLLEYRLFLAALGVRDYTKSPNLEALMAQLKLNNEELLTQLQIQFEDKHYYKTDIERTMNIELISLMSDIPFSCQIVESIFTLNPYSSVSRLLRINRAVEKIVFTPKGSELVNKDEFYLSLAQITQEWEEAKEFLANPKQIKELTDFLQKDLKVLGVFFAGRGFGKGLAALVSKKEAADSYEALLKDYFKKNEDKIMMFDEVERQVVLSSMAHGACMIDCAHELCIILKRNLICDARPDLYDVVWNNAPPADQKTSSHQKVDEAMLKSAKETAQLMARSTQELGAMIRTDSTQIALASGIKSTWTMDVGIYYGH